MLRPPVSSSRPSEPAAEVEIPPSSAVAIASCDDLRYSSDTEPGFRRRRAGSGFVYLMPTGKRVTNQSALARIRKLAVPPAYRDVWICTDPSGHLQATGIDARGRKQYRYHERWRVVRDAHKFERMVEFGRALPRLHRRIARDLALPGMPKDKVLATIVRLLETTLIRVGNLEYARSNRSYGLTTLRNRHADVKGTVVRFRFRGKHGIQHDVEVEDPRAARVVRQCLELPGQELFGYVDEDGEVRDVGSSEVNAYLKEISRQDFTAKDFRTWYATSQALESFMGKSFRTAPEARTGLKEVLLDVSQRLGNTPTMCRKCYINPVVIDAFLAGELRQRRSTKRGGERVRLLRMLAQTPGGVGFGSSRVPRRSRRSQRLH